MTDLLAPSAPADLTPDTYVVPTFAFAAVTERAAALAKLADRLGVDPVRVIVLREFTQPVAERWLSEAECRRRRGVAAADLPQVDHVEFAVLGDTPCLPGGWHLLGVIEHTPEGNLVAASPSGREVGLAARYAAAEATCDYCGLTRNRKVTFVLADENGTETRVGRGCLVGHLGLAGFPEDALWRLMGDLADAADEGWVPGGRTAPTFTEVVTVAAALVRTEGYVRTDEYMACSTRDAVAQHLANPRETPVDITADDEATAQAIVAWLGAMTEPDGDFLANLAVLARLGFVEAKRMGLAVAAVPAYRRHLGLVAREAARAEAQAQRTEAVLGANVTITGTVTGTDVRDTGYGYRHVMTVTDDRGFVVWGTVPASIDGVGIGDRVSFVATVEPSDADPTFGFIKRPRKATRL